MSGRWWRAYGRARHDPKLLKLSDKDFRWWFNLVCAASDNGGVLPLCEDLAVEFRVSPAAMSKTLDRMVASGLFDHDETGIHPHNWNALQYVSDRSSERVKAFRERQRNVSVTPSETETETETEKKKTGGAGAPCASDDLGIAFDDFTKTAAECNWPKPRGLEADRRKKLKARLDEHGLDGWRLMLANAKASEFLRTKFALKFDWVLEPRNFRKVLEGNYGAVEGASLPVTTGDEIQWAARVRGWTPGRFWNRGDWGPPPNEPGCRAPAHLITQWRPETLQ